MLTRIQQNGDRDRDRRRRRRRRCDFGCEYIWDWRSYRRCREAERACRRRRFR